MYSIESLHIHEPEPGITGDKKTICAVIRCDGYEARELGRGYGDTIAPYGCSEMGADCITVTVDYTDDERTLAKRIKAKIAEMKVDRTAETLLLGKVRQLGPAALNP